MKTAPELLQDIFDADRNLRKAERSLINECTETDIRKVLEMATEEALAHEDPSEASMRLERLSDLCAQITGPTMIDTLIKILNHQEARVRVSAGEALTDVAYERYAEVAHAIDRALEQKLPGPALRELPWILCEIGEPSAPAQIARFLESQDPDTVASAIEALTQLGEAQATRYLVPLSEDTRGVVIEEFEENIQTTIGELAQEAIAFLEKSE